MESSSRLPSLDGWRAVSILLVLAAHSKFVPGFPQEFESVFYWLFSGNMGVRTFFVISGFLITWLMLVERSKTGRISLKHFYIRRILRIFPVYFAFLAVVLVLQWLTPFSQGDWAWIANLTFTTGINPPGAGNTTTTGHLWSLAVEEQFYILWPLLFVALSLSLSRRKALFCLAIPIIAAPIFRALVYLKSLPGDLSWIVTNYTFPTNCDSLAVGCAAAFIFRDYRGTLAHWLTRSPWPVFCGALLIIIVPHTLYILKVAGALTVPFAQTAHAVGAVILIMQSILLPEWGPYRWLNHPAVIWVGVLSYSLYIWQQIFCSGPATFGLPEVWWMSFPGWLVPTFLVSCASYYLLEQPFMRLRAKFRDA
jgi:peptidoglycan/LPS O-acetylase OafA/YrhL